MKVLWASDGVVKTGFEFVSRGFLEQLQLRGWEPLHLAIGATGDPHDYSWQVFPAHVGGDHLGIGRIGKLCRDHQPDVVVISGDSWVVPMYLPEIPKGTKVVAYCPVDAPNQPCGKLLNRCQLVLAPTLFGVQELVAGGYTGAARSIGYGINTNLYEPMHPVDARKALGMPKVLQDAYIIGNVNRNAPRKRIDLTLKAFQHYRALGGDGYLLLHMAVRDTWGIDILQAVNYMGISDHIVLTGGRNEADFVPFNKLKLVYSCLDHQVSTTVGEGWGLTTAEGMASGVANTVPEYSALGEWARGGVQFYDIADTAINIGLVNTIWGIPDYQQLGGYMRFMQQSAGARADLAVRGLAHIQQPHFTWDAVGKQMDEALREVVDGLE